MDFDVVILGAGLAGLALARHLTREIAGVRVGLVDPGPLPADRRRSKVGESATEASSWYLAERLGLRDLLEETQLKKLGLRFFLGGGASGPFAERPEFGLMTPAAGVFSLPFTGVNPTTWQLHRGRLEHDLYVDLCAAGVVARPGTRGEVRLGAPHVVALVGPEGVETWRARWVIDASGSGGVLPDGDDRPLDHVGQAAWFWVPTAIDVGGFTDDPGFQGRIPPDLRWRSTTHLVGPGYWVWLIRLADGGTSVGVVSDPNLHPPAQFTDLAHTLRWLAAHEPEAAAAVGQAGEITGFHHRVWQSHARRVLASDERWAVTGDTAAFLDPLFSSGLDLTSIGNELLVPLIRDDLAGEDVAGRCRRSSALFLRLAEQYLGLYRGVFQIMGHPRAMMAKIHWDLATYFGFLAPVVRSGALADEAFMSRVGHFGRSVATLQARVSALLQAWAAADPGCARGVVDQSSAAALGVLVAHLRRPATPDEVLGQLSENLRVLEQLAVAIFRQAALAGGLAAPEGALNPYAVGLDPSRWEADGLVGGANPVDVPPWMAAALAPVWLP